MDDIRMARSLGWFSIGLGLSEVLAPEKMSEMIGLDDHPHVLRLCGLREITTGIGILARRVPTRWLWARVAGDLVDLAVLGIGLNGSAKQRQRLAMAAAAVGGVMLLDIVSGKRLGGRRSAFGRSPRAGGRTWPATRSALSNLSTARA
jgi:hypothetical protein